MTSKQLFKFVSLQIMKSWFHFVHNERNRYYACAQSGYLWIPVSKVPHDLVSPHSLIIKVKLWFSGTPASQCFHYTARSLSKAQQHHSRGCEPADATQTRAGTCWRWGGQWGDCCNIKPSSVTDWKHVQECPVMLNRSLCLLSEGRLRFMLRVINSLPHINTWSVMLREVCRLVACMNRHTNTNQPLFPTLDLHSFFFYPDTQLALPSTAV